MLVEVKCTSGLAPPVGVKASRSKTTLTTLTSIEEARRVAEWFFRNGAHNHRVVNGKMRVDYMREGYFAEIPSIEWFIENYGDGRVVIELSDFVDVKWCVEIYDDYRE